MDGKQWKDMIDSSHTDFNSLETNKNRAKRILSEKVTFAVKNGATDNCAVLFSGGIDSTLISFIMKKYGINFTCYAVGLENSQDLDWAERVSKSLGFKLKAGLLNLDEFENIVKKVVKILKEPDVMKVSVGCVTYAASLLAKQDGINVVFSGLGSEEIFAGYQRHEEVLKNGLDALHEECWSGLKAMWQRDIMRDVPITKELGLLIKTPFLDIDVIKCAMSIHPMYKMDKDFKKIIIREVAQDLGLPKEFAWRKKKAAQYGSNFIKGLDKLAKKNGFLKKKEYLQSLLD